jgi:hypothetical protein
MAIASPFAAQAIGCAEGEAVDPSYLHDPSERHTGTGGKNAPAGSGGSTSLPAGGSSGMPDTQAGGSSNEAGSTGSGGTGMLADSGTSGSGGSAGNTGSGGTGNMPMDAAVVPIDAPLAKGVVVFYHAGDTGNMNDTIAYFLNVVNNGTTAVPLNALKVRYYFTDELNGVGKQVCYDSSTATYPGMQNYKSYTGSTKETVAMMPMVTGANSYLEVTVNSTDQLAAGSALSLQCAYAAPAGQPLNETNDYSANLTQGTFAETTKIVVYQGTTIVAGMVPQ